MHLLPSLRYEGESVYCGGVSPFSVVFSEFFGFSIDTVVEEPAEGAGAFYVSFLVGVPVVRHWYSWCACCYKAFLSFRSLGPLTVFWVSLAAFSFYFFLGRCASCVIGLRLCVVVSFRQEE